MEGEFAAQKHGSKWNSLITQRPAQDGQTRIGWSNQHDTPAKGAVGARIRIMKVAGMVINWK
jgi:hypothetical protein